MGPGGWTFKQKIRPTAGDVPSLKCKAAQCRGVQDFVPDLAGVLHTVRDTPHTQRVKELASHFVGGGGKRPRDLCLVYLVVPVGAFF